MGAREGGCERGVRLQFRLRVSRNYARRTTRHVSAPNNSCGGVEGQSEGERKREREREKGTREEEGHPQKSRTWRAQRRHALARPDMYIFPANILRCRTNVPRNPCDDSARARALADKGRQKAEMRNANGIPFSALSSFTGSCKKIETRLGARGRSREGETGTAATVFAQS